MIKIENGEVYSTEGKTIHRIDSDCYFSRATTLPSDTEATFEEVDSIPAYTKAQYEAKVAEMVRERYTADEEFALQRKAMNLMLNPEAASEEGADPTPILNEFNAYCAYVDSCKERAKDASLYTTDPCN